MGPEQWTDFWLVDAFAREPFRGNPAGVILKAEGLDADFMRLIAREVGASDSAFISPPTEEGVDLNLRWFTPTCEIPFSGHATVAALHVLAETGRYAPPAELTLATLSGPLKTRLCQHEEDGACIYMVQGLVPRLEPSPIQREEVAEALLLSPESLHPDLPLRKEGINLYVPLRQLSTLLNMFPDLRRLSRLGLDHEITGFACFTTETVEPSASWHMRFFAPGMGIGEDPVTGVTQGPMAAYLLEQGVLSARPGETLYYTGEQGDALERHGRVRVELTMDAAGHIDQVFIGGTAVTVLQGRLRVG